MVNCKFGGNWSSIRCWFICVLVRCIVGLFLLMVSVWNCSLLFGCCLMICVC